MSPGLKIYSSKSNRRPGTAGTVRGVDGKFSRKCK